MSPRWTSKTWSLSAPFNWRPSRRFIARQFGTAFVVCEEGQTRDIPPGQTQPYEDRLLANAEQLNQRIQFLKQSEPTDYSLNDKPAK